MDCLRLVTRPPWPGSILVAVAAAVLVAAVAIVAAVVAVVVAAVVGAATVVVDVAAVVKTSQWYLDPARAGSDFSWGQMCPPFLRQ